MHCHGRSSLLRRSRAAERRYVASTVTVMTRMSDVLGLRLHSSVPVASPHKRRQLDSPPKRPGGFVTVLLPPPCRRPARGEKGTCPANAQQRPPGAGAVKPRKIGQAPGPRRAVRRREASAGDHGPPPKGQHKQPADATSHVGASGRARCSSSKATCQCQLQLELAGQCSEGGTDTDSDLRPGCHAPG